jgi:hypothetical protein
MKITLFTSNQPRHLSFIHKLSEICDKVYVIQECHSAFPGKEDGFYRKSDAMKAYFSYVLEAEKKVFGGLSFTPPNVRTLSLKAGEVSLLQLEDLKEALESDYYIIFGASYIKGELCDWLVQHRAINIHMGISPYYRGNSCNFWAMYDGRPDLVGATIHFLEKGLDSGKILFHVLPAPTNLNPFILGMQAVNSAQRGLIEEIRKGNIDHLTSVNQCKNREFRYTKNVDFTDEIAVSYLNNLPSERILKEKLTNRDFSIFVKPRIL